MKKFRELNWFKKLVVLLNVAAIVIGFFAYLSTCSRVGFLYKNEILVRSEEGNNTVYTGKIRNRNCKMIITEDKVITLETGVETYGPYHIEEDPSLNSKNIVGEDLTGIRIYNNDKIIYEGSFSVNQKNLYLYNKEGVIEDTGLTFTSVDGEELDVHANVIHKFAPRAYDIACLIYNPTTSYKGNWGMYILGAVVSTMDILFVFNEKELFKHKMSWLVKNPDEVEATEFEIVTRQLYWVLLLGIVVFIMTEGLRVLL